MTSRKTVISLALILGSLGTLSYLSIGSHTLITLICLTMSLVGLGGLAMRCSDKLEALQEIIIDKNGQIDVLRRAFMTSDRFKISRASTIIRILVACPSRRPEWLGAILNDVWTERALAAVKIVTAKIENEVAHLISQDATNFTGHQQYVTNSRLRDLNDQLNRLRDVRAHIKTR